MGACLSRRAPTHPSDTTASQSDDKPPEPEAQVAPQSTSQESCGNGNLQAPASMAQSETKDTPTQTSADLNSSPAPASSAPQETSHRLLPDTKPTHVSDAMSAAGQGESTPTADGGAASNSNVASISGPQKTTVAESSAEKDCVAVIDKGENNDDESSAKLLEAADEDDWEVVADVLRTAGASIDPNARTPSWGNSLLRSAAEGGSYEVCRSLLDLRADVNILDTNGMTPLMGAVTGADNAELVRLLVSARANVDAKTDDGFTALAWATRLKYEGSIAVLRDAGATGADTPF